MRHLHLILFLLCCFAFQSGPLQAQTSADYLKPRLIVETDAGGDPDDEASLVRLLMFADQFELEAIIADRSNSQIERRSTYQNLIESAGGDGEDLVERYITDYGELHANLQLHGGGDFPSEADLKAITVVGHNSSNAGRDAIIAAVDKDDPRPVWYGNWGSNSGSTSNLKRALDYVEANRSQEEYEAFASRLRICSLDGGGRTRQRHEAVIPLHIETGYPDLGGRWYHQFRPITETAGGFNVNRDLRSDHGELGAHYTTAKEGDSWCFVYLQNQAIGLGVPTRVAWGGWGGRYAGLRTGADFPNDAFYWNDQSDTWNGSTSRNNTAARFAADMQHQFAARMDWGRKSQFSGANHAPEVVVNGDSRGTVVRLFAQPGQQVALSAAGSSDPDGDSLSYEWIRYDEADSYSGSVTLTDANTRDVMVHVPGDADGTTIQLVLQVKDDGDATPESGNPSMMGYRRVVIYVREQLKIMPLGDSVTDGHHWSDNGNGAYRRKLWTMMQSAGWNVDFVGAKSNGGPGMDQDHEGYVGYRIDELYGDADGREPNVELASKLDTYQPDIILLIIGANDALQNTDIPNADHRYVKLLNLIYAHCPDAYVVMGNVQTMEKGSYTVATGDAINAQMPLVVAAAYHMGLWPAYLDCRALLDHPADFCDDKVHPNQAGDDKLGEAFYGLIEDVRATGSVNTPPQADAGPDQSVADSDGLIGESVILDGSGSSDADGVVSSYLWTEGGTEIASGVNPAVALSDGEHILTLTVTDDGGSSGSDTVVITVAGPPDLEDPSVPTDVSASNTTHNGTELSWSPSTDNIDPAPQYEIFQDGSSIGTTASTTFTISGLTTSTTYAFTVRAEDAAGNASAQSAAVSVTTLAAPPAYLEAGGLLVMEAEAYDNEKNQGDPWFETTTESGYAGDGYVTTQDDGTGNGSWATTDSLGYDLVIQTDGTYHIWMRISQAGGAGNSAYVGVDGTQVGGTFDNGSGSGWVWKEAGGTVALTAGDHVFDLRRREDGYRVDRILLTTDGALIPTGEGPAESERGGGNADADGDHLLDDWESEHGQSGDLDSDGDLDPTSDLDGDGATVREEFEAGTDPNDANSVLRITSVTVDPISGQATVQWNSLQDGSTPPRLYRLMKTTDLSQNWTEIQGNITPSGIGANTGTDTIDPEFSQCFYCVEIEGTAP